MSLDLSVAHRLGGGVRAFSLFSLLLLAGSLPLAAQQDVSAAGGTVVSAAGSVSYTYGQAVCAVALSPVAGVNVGNAQAGVQQSYLPLVPDTVLMDACDNYYWPKTGLIYSASGFYDIPVPNRNGANGTLTLWLRLHPSYVIDTAESVCDSFRWDVTGLTYHKSGVISHTDTSRYGCDSLHRLDLTVRRSSNTYLRDQHYGGSEWRGMTLTESGVYRYLLGTNAVGCDSAEYLTLVVLHDYPMPRIVHYNREKVMVDHYPGLTDPSGNAAVGLDDSARIDYHAYRWYHDGVLIPQATGDVYADYSSGAFQELHGCYYVEVLMEPGSPFWVASNVICMELGIDDVASPQVSLYPNPVASGSPLYVETAYVPQGTELRVYDMQGRQVAAQPSDGNISRLPLQVPAGVYSLVVRLEDASPLVRRFVVR